MDYKSGKIYCIRNFINEEIYVGSTTQPLSKRMAWHRRDRNLNIMAKRPLYKLMGEIGVEHFYIELIEEYPCDNKDQLRAREGFYIRKQGTLNKVIIGRTKKEYTEDTKEQRHQYDKERRQNNIEFMLEKDRARRQIVETCEICGVRYTKPNKSRHIKSKKHQTTIS